MSHTRNGHFGCSCYHPLFVFNQFGDLERCGLRAGHVHSAEGWRIVLSQLVNFEKAVEGPNGYADGRNQRSSGECWYKCVNTRIAVDVVGMMLQIMKRLGLPLALALFCLFGAGPAWLQTGAVAQTSSAAAMSGPMRVTDSPLGLLVGDYVGGGVLFVNPVTLALEDTVPITGKPLGVAWMNGRVYVGDERTGAIEVYERVSRGGKKNTKNQKNDKKSLEWVQVTANLTGSVIGGPADIVADEDLGLLFVASKGDKTIYVLDETGAVVRTIGGPGSTNPVGQPQGLALDRVDRRIYVSDDGAEVCTWLGCSPSSLVHVYDYDGTFLGAISGDSGQENFGFSRAQGVTVDNFGDVYLVDSWRGQVLVFDEVSANSWTGIGTFGSKGAGIKELLLPMDVVVDQASSTVYVTNPMKGRVEVFTFEDMVQ